MFSRDASVQWLSLAILAALLSPWSSLPACQAESQSSGEQPTKVAGILLERKDNWLSVKADGEDEPFRYSADASNRELTEALKGIFNASRVQLTYRTVGDARQLLTIKRQIFKPSGTVTGTVVKVYDNFWVEVKPKTGVSDAYAPNVTNYKNQQFMDQLKGLKPGDSVTIRFTTDFERHRIETLRVNATASAPAARPGKPR